MIKLKLGDFTFARGEVPENIGFGASQNLHVHTLVGGTRVIDAMGGVPLQIEWSGWLTGPQALTRARYLKTMAEAGRPLALTFGEFAYTVAIARFSAEFRAGPNLPYTVALEIVQDQSSAGQDLGRPGLAQAVAQDMTAAIANALVIGDSELNAAVDSVSFAVTASGGEFTPATIRPLMPAIAAAQEQAAVLDSHASAQIAALGPLSVAMGGAGPDPLSQFSTGLAAAVDATYQSSLLNATEQLLARMASNLAAGSGTAGAGGPVLTVGSGDLYHLAAAAYGDARRWTQIAQANRLTDPVLSGIRQLLIPPEGAVPATGVLNA